jgi:nucleotide-binding universal stress UspA family protein
MYRSILVPLDGSRFGEQALPLALAVARRAGASLKLLHVHAPLVAGYPEGPVYFREDLEVHLRNKKRAIWKLWSIGCGS